ncbi:MAG TPA: hypothetical protein VED46_08515, partial [Alphaproteobacteria bacterium]|nr:hypothetical protein [Alphaproteobacteria bacterium]
MTREPRWLVHRSEEALTVRVGSFYTPTTYRVPLASEPELRSWFRRRRWQGWAAALPLVIVSTIAAMWIGSGIVLWIAGVAVGWSILVETTSMRFERAFPVARLLHQKRGANAIFGIEPDGSAVVLPSGTFKTYRLNAEDAARFLIWRRRMMWQGMLFLLPPVPVYLLTRPFELTLDATIGIFMTALLVSTGASVYWTGRRFRREFPAAVQVEMPA